MSDVKTNYLPKFGVIDYGENNSLSVSDFEQSFLSFISSKEDSPLYTEELKEFGQENSGEIDNPSLEDFEESFIKYFS